MQKDIVNAGCLIFAGDTLCDILEAFGPSRRSFLFPSCFIVSTEEVGLSNLLLCLRVIIS